jgi:phage-related protein
MFDIHIHVRPNGRCPFTEYVESIRRSGGLASATRITRVVEALEDMGSQALVSLRRSEKMNDVWQLRSGPHRIFYFWDRSNRRYVILNGFRKRTERTPRREIQRAERLMQEYFRFDS